MANNYKKDCQTRAHDIAGFETDRTDFSEYDDGYGNKVAHGDASVLDKMETGGRAPHSSNLQPLDKHPWMKKY